MSKSYAWKVLAAVVACLGMSLQLYAQDVRQVQFCDKKYEYGSGRDSITLYLKITDGDGRRVRDITARDLGKYLDVYEDDVRIIGSRRKISPVGGGLRIPADYTFSVLVDLSIPDEGKMQIYEAVRKLVETAPDSCVYLSFFGDEVTPSMLVTRRNLNSFKPRFLIRASEKYFYGALYAKMAEFDGGRPDAAVVVRTSAGYHDQPAIASRARTHKDKILLFLFTEGSRQPSFEPSFTYLEVTDYQRDSSHIVPRVFVFYYGSAISEDLSMTFEGITSPHDAAGRDIWGRQGRYTSSTDLGVVVSEFEQVVQDAMYDFAYTYKATDGKMYAGKTSYRAEWDGEPRGEGTFSVGTAENPWPTLGESTGGVVLKIMAALLVTLLTVGVFFIVMKVLIPMAKSKAFEMKHYKRYEPEANVNRRICHYCKQDLQPGQMIVTKCAHYMHVHCWKQNGHKCSEYGQNCKTGIQEHVDWKNLLTMSSLRDCRQMMAGVCAGLMSWVVYELTGRGGFAGMASAITEAFLQGDEQKVRLFHDTCVTQVSAFLVIGLLLGFFLSLAFRYGDEYRKRDWRVYAKIAGLSLLSALVGMLSFSVGGIVLCALVSAMDVTFMPWYCSFPAYLLFSACLTLSLTVKSTIPVRSAMMGGVCSAVIGFLVLYFSASLSSSYGWMSMLLDFVIYGGGLGASLVTVRLLAEKYFLIVKNGVRANWKIPVHKWMNATGGGNKVTIGMTGGCEIQMNWEKSNKVAKEHAQLYIDPVRQLPVIKPLATGVVFNMRAELPVVKPAVLTNGDTFSIGDTTFQYVETD